MKENNDERDGKEEGACGRAGCRAWTRALQAQEEPPTSALLPTTKDEDRSETTPLALMPAT